ncbi:iron ABC transporter permease [Jiella sp. MQZ9-1]|uniref:FecCD family ABC transporter permease n=1 Tax=Jiella flava TaxID=2816857 RepID=UPI001E5E4BEE|nr:iron ABC transporter permease [Jiella flava]
MQGAGGGAHKASLTLALGFVAVLFGLHVLQGPRNVPLETFPALLFDRSPASFDQFVILHLRLPRILAVVMAGACLGAAGFLLQTAMRNRLGEPHILGLNAGASLAVVVLTAFPLIPLPVAAKPFAASLGAFLLFGAVLALSAGGRDRFSPVRVIFFGIALSAMANALVSAILILDEDTLEQLRFWLLGDSAGVQMSAIAAAAPTVVIGLVGAALVMPRLAALSLGDNLARGLGASVKRTRLIALLMAALLSGSAVSLIGPIGFVGLVAPALWPRLHNKPSVAALLLVTLSGAGLLLAADSLAAGILAPRELPTGALTGLVGAPVFIWLVLRTLR